MRLSTGNSLQLSDAALLASLSELAYADEEEVSKTAPRLDLDLVTCFNRVYTQGFIVATEQDYICAFRGTETTERGDIFHDLDMRRTRTPAGKIHTGFLAALDNVWDDIRLVIRRDLGDRRLWFTGHSLGGALAALAASRCVIENDIPVAGLHTFGQPRVGCRQFAAKLKRVLANKYFRFINNEDTVPNFPLAFRFRHAGQMCWFDKQGKLHFPTGIRALGMYSSDIFQISATYEDGEWQKTTDTLADHSMATYRNLVRQALLESVQSDTSA